MPDDSDRYARQTLLPGVGADGQRRLLGATVLLVGAGGLGAPVALYLAAAGVGRLVLVDDDRVALSNLQRQVLYTTADVGRLKVDAATDRLRALNPDVQVDARADRLTAANARALVRDADLVVDGSDSFAVRYLVSDACVLEDRPAVHGAVSRFEGQVTVLRHTGGPCYRCLYPTPPSPEAIPSCAEGGVLGAVVGAVGTLQAVEALKVLLGIGDVLAGRLLLLDALGGHVRTLAFARRADCPACGTAPSIDDVVPLVEACDPWDLSATAARARLEAPSPPLLVDVRTADERATGHLGGRHIPLDTLDDALPSLDPARPLLVYCRSGARSARAAARLRAAGFAAYTLAGGLDAWPGPVMRTA